MPQGKGTYGSKKGRPPKKTKDKAKTLWDTMNKDIMKNKSRKARYKAYEDLMK